MPSAVCQSEGMKTDTQNIIAALLVGAVLGAFVATSISRNDVRVPASVEASALRLCANGYRQPSPNSSYSRGECYASIIAQWEAGARKGAK